MKNFLPNTLNGIFQSVGAARKNIIIITDKTPFVKGFQNFLIFFEDDFCPTA